MLWIIFAVAVVAMLALDLGVFNRAAHTPRFREAIGWSIAWSGLAFVFMCVVYLWRGPGDALDFLTGYLVEWSLSVDNIFVFLLIFEYFRVPPAFQHRILFWGIVGAVIMRAILIGLGVFAIQQLHWIVYVFGGFLVLTGLRMATQKELEVHPERNPVLRLARRLLPVSTSDTGQRLFTVEQGRRMVTPLFIVLLVVETTDVVFAVDSVPAVLAITRDPVIVYTSNIFAILGLRALYFTLAGTMGLFYYLRYGLAAILVFVGAKMLIGEVYEIPSPVALAVIAALLTTAIVASLVRRRVPSDAAPDAPGGRGPEEIS